MKWLMPVTLALFSGACTTTENLERLEQTEFNPIGDSVFEYRALASPVLRPEDSSGAEQERIKWLEQYLHDNGFCQNGYNITERRTVLLVEGLLGASYDIFYTVRCKL